VNTVAILDILPFFRYAVGPSSGSHPAIPFYRRTEAEGFFERIKQELPWAGVRLYRRQWFGKIETLAEYRPASANGAGGDRP
jgi:hypothetical protein